MGLKQKILAFLSSEELPNEVTKLADQKLEDGTIITSEDWSEGGAIFIKGEEEDANVKLPKGEYQVDGKALVLEEDGIIKSYNEEVKEESKEESKEEELTEEPKEEEMAEDVKEEVLEEDNKEEAKPVMKDDLLVMINKLEELLNRMDSGEFLSKQAPKEEVKEEVKLSTQEAEEDPKPIVHKPSSVEKKTTFYFGKN
jgi:hypothetical protein